MTAIHSKLKLPWRSYSVGIVSFILAACAHNPTETASIDVASPQLQRFQLPRAPIGTTEQKASSLDVNQIATANTGLKARQILPEVDAVQLTVEQLQTYVDRCARGSSLPQGDLDCSELSLRVKKVFQSKDVIQEALITLDRLGRNGIENTGQNELEQNSRNLSNSAQGIASGLLEPTPTDTVQEPQTDNLDSILNQLISGQSSGG